MTFRPDREAPPELRQAEALEHIASILDGWAEQEEIGWYA